MTTRGAGKYSVPREEKPCAHCRASYVGTVRSKYCSTKCSEASKHAKRMADPARRAVAMERRRKARSTYNEKNPPKYIPVSELSEEAKTLKRQRVTRYRARKAAVLNIAYTHEQLRAKIAYWNNSCWMCQGAWDSMDHVKPISKGGPNILANLRPSCTPCNTKKKDKWPYNPERP